MDYRLRNVLAVGVGATFVLAHLGQFVSPWAAWAAPVLVAAVVGAVVAEGNNGAGAGALTAGGGGFLFVFGEVMSGPVGAELSLGNALTYAVINGINTFALFGIVGMVAGGIAGLSSAYAQGRAGADDDERAESADD